MKQSDGPADIDEAPVGDPKEQCALGLAYAKGQNGERDFVKAAYFYRLAAQAGLVVAQYNLADMYVNGHGLPKDDEQALFWFLKAAEQGDADAKFNIAMILARTKSLEEGFDWFKRAAEAGLGRAQYEVAVHYLDGIGVPYDRAQALYWLGLAAEQGVPRAKQLLDSLSR